MQSRGWRWATALSLITASGFASAADPPSDAQAPLSKLLRTGTDAANAKKWPACIDAFTEALAIKDDPNTAGALGLCEESAGRFTDAHTHLMHAIEKVTPSMETREPWTSYERALVRLRDHVAMLYVTTTPSGASVWLDDKPIGVANGRGLPVAPGKHVVTAKAPGYEDAIEPARTWAARDVPAVDLTLKPKAPPPARPTAATSSTTTATGPGAPRAPWWRPLVPSLDARGAGAIVAYSSAALALGSTGLMIGLEVDRASMTKGHASNTCAGDAGSTAFCTTLHDRRDQRTVAGGAAIGFGTLAIGTGLAVVLAQVFRRAPVVAPAASKDAGGLVIQGAW
ncbi:MAG: PEGA domain-containing protein [Polyangiaceae bacterium]